MTSFRHLERLASALDKCGACGQCLSVCPSFQQSGRMADSPRGRLALLKAWLSGSLAESDIIDALDACLLCGRCSRICPAGLELPEIFIASRADLPARATGLQGFVARRLLAMPRFLELGRQCLQTRRKGLSLKSLFSGGRPEEQGQAGNEGQILVFTGCMVKFFQPELLEACGHVLDHYGKSWKMPPFSCCGASENYAGRGGRTRGLVRRNLKLLAREKYEKLAFLCPHCLEQIRDVWPVLPWLDDAELAQAKEIAQKAVSIAELPIIREASISLASDDESICFHKPCRLSQTEAENIEALFNDHGANIKGFASSCCGNFIGQKHPLERVLAGKFPPRFRKGAAIKEPDSKLWPAARLRDECQASRADILLTACPGCKQALSAEIRRNLGKGEVRHWLEVLAERLL